MKKIAILPTILTLGNAVCGFAAIAYAGKIGHDPANDAFYFALSGWLIVAAMVFDSLDGYAARMTRSASKFGGELDSLCDAVSFGVAPGFLLLRMGPSWETPTLHRILAVVAALFMVCAILRLARFNVENQPESNSAKRFRGLPSPAAAGCVASLAVLRGQSLPGVDEAVLLGWIEAWATAGSLVVALLMVSRIGYPRLDRHILRGRRPFSHLIQILVAIFLFMMLPQLALALVFWGYALVFLGRAAWLRARQHQSAPVLDDTPLSHP